MWLLRYHNYHIRRAIRDETGALTPALLTHAIFSIRLYLSERGLRGEGRRGGRLGGDGGETGGSPGAYLSLKSHLHALSILFFLKRSLYQDAKSSQRIDKGAVVWVQSARLRQVQ